MRHALVFQALNDQLGGRAIRFAHTSEPNCGSANSTAGLRVGVM